MKYIIALIFCLLNFISFSQQNLNVDYKPLKSQGLLPEIFTKSVKETIADEINDLKKEPDSISKIKTNLFTITNYEIAWQIKSGKILINDEITDYLNTIVDVILKDQPELRKKIHVYTSKSPVVNALAYYNGTIFINLGYLAHTKNEAQVAYALCHEIAHYLEKHTIERAIHNENLVSTSEGKTNEDIFKEYCNYSKDHESDADSVGFNLLKATKYDVNQTMEVFDILQHYELPFELIPFDKSFFETKNFIIPDKYVLATLAAIKDNSNEDDSEHTHPNTAKRKEGIKKMLPDDITGSLYLISESKFNYIRELAQFEICRLYLRYRDYNAALYSAYVLSKKYPDNLFLAQTISKCLYAISLNHTGHLRYNKDSYLDGPIHYLQVESYPQQLYYLINKLSDNEWNVMSLNYVFRQHKKFANDKIISAISDSLIKTMYYVNAQFETSGKENEYFVNVNSNPDTASWYKYVFADLFATEKEFAEKFPKTIGNEFKIPYKPKSYHVNRFSQKMRTVENIGIVLCLQPRYKIYYEDLDLEYYHETVVEQKNLLASIKNCALKQDFQLVVLDPGHIDSTEVNKLNDYSVVIDWLIECSDADENEESKVPIFNTDELQDVIDRYGTSHVLRTGFIIFNSKVKEYVFFSVIYDLKQNRQVYIKQELFKGKPSKNDVQNKICALFDELKTGK